MLRSTLSLARSIRDEVVLPRSVKEERQRDRSGLMPDPGIDRCVGEALAWLARAQDHSTSRDGGVARHYSLLHGWSASYPETTGYIIPTMLACAHRLQEPVWRERAQRMLDWLVSIQMPSGAFQGGMITQTPVAPVTFNTGQILLGLAAGVAEFGDVYRPALDAAATWLVSTQGADGAWRRYGSPFTSAGDKAYETHVSWGLFEAARVASTASYGDAGIRQVRWSLTRQAPNGWFADCDLVDARQPLTHTLGYVLRGILEAYRYSEAPEFLAAARLTGEALLAVQRPNGAIPGRLDHQWRGTVSWVCLTGSVQIASCWLILYELTGDDRYLNAAQRANEYVRRTMRVDGTDEQRGGVKGSFPTDGAYGKYEYLNWAAKFFIDANLLEQDIVASQSETDSNYLSFESAT